MALLLAPFQARIRAVLVAVEVLFAGKTAAARHEAEGSEGKRQQAAHGKGASSFTLCRLTGLGHRALPNADARAGGTGCHARAHEE